LKDLTHGPEARTIFYFSLPMLIGNVFQQLYNMVDGIVVGRFVGPDAFAAVGTSFPLMFLMLALILGLGMGVSTIISQLYGAGRHDDVRRAISTTYILMAACGVFLTVVGLLTADWLLQNILAVPGEIFPDASAYLRIIYTGMLPMFFYNMLSSVLRALGDSKTPLYFLILATCLNIGLDILFVAAYGWGVPGVAYATVIAQVVSAVACVIYIYIKIPVMRFKPGEFTFDSAIFRQALRLGLPASLQQVVLSLGFIAVQRLVNSFGASTMSAFSASSRIDQLATMPLLNLQMAISSFAAQNIGANKMDRVRRGYHRTLFMAAGLSIAMGILILIFSKQLISIFVPTAEGEVFIQGQSYLHVVAYFYSVFAVMCITVGLLRGAGDALFTTLSTLTSFVARLAIAYVLAYAFSFGPNSIWWSLPPSWFVGLTIVLLRYNRGRWKELNLLDRLSRNDAAPASSDHTSVSETILPEDIS